MTNSAINLNANEHDVLLESNKKYESNNESEPIVNIKEIKEPSTNSSVASKITLAVFVITALILLSVSIYLICTMPRIKKHVEALPRNAHLCLIDLDEFLNTSSITISAKLQVIQDNLLKLSSYGIQSVAIFSRNMFSPDNTITDEFKKGFTKLSDVSYFYGVNTGLVLTSNFINNDKNIDAITDLRVLSFYHIYNEFDKAHMTNILKFNNYFNKTNFLSLEQSNNIIIVERYNDNVVNSIQKYNKSISSYMYVFNDNVEYNKKINLSESPKILFSTSPFEFFRDYDKVDFDKHLLLVIKSAFLSYGAVFNDADVFNYGGVFNNSIDSLFPNNTDGTKMKTADPKYEKLLNFSRNFYTTKSKTELWDHVEKYYVKTAPKNYPFSGLEVYVLDVNSTDDKTSMYDYVVLIQNSNTDEKKLTFNLNDIDLFKNHSVAHLILSSNDDINPTLNIRLNISDITLEPIQSIILALYLPDKKFSVEIPKKWPFE